MLGKASEMEQKTAVDVLHYIQEELSKNETNFQDFLVFEFGQRDYHKNQQHRGHTCYLL